VEWEREHFPLKVMVELMIAQPWFTPSYPSPDSMGTQDPVFPRVYWRIVDDLEAMLMSRF